MLDNRDNRNLSDVFKELQEMQQTHSTSSPKRTKRMPKTKNISNYQNRTLYKDYDLKLHHIIVGCGILIIGLAVFFPKNTSFTQSYAKEENITEESKVEIEKAIEVGLEALE